MHDNIDPESRSSPLEGRLKALGEEPAPDRLLERCLTTVRGAPRDARPSPRPRTAWRWSGPVAAAAAVLLISVLGLSIWPTRSASAFVLREVHDALAEVPAIHYVLTLHSPAGERVTEAWVLRDKGRREEVRTPREQIGVVVHNGRWEFRWDIPGHLIAAWSSAVVGGPNRALDENFAIGSESFLKWAEAHRAQIQDGADTLDGRTVRKIALSWPGPAGGPVPQTETFWFDPVSPRPLRMRSESGDGIVTEIRIDYPAPEAIPQERFALSPPRDVTLEINDPDLGRQVYSEGQTQPADNARGGEQ